MPHAIYEYYSSFFPSPLEEISLHIVTNHRQVFSAVNRINNFASTNTKGKINDLVTVENIEGIHMAIVNAAYFKGTWQFQFKPTSTASERFFVTPQSHQMVPMMNQISAFNFGKEKGCLGMCCGSVLQTKQL